MSLLVLPLILLFNTPSLAHAGFFDLTDVEDPFALFWNLPIHQKLTQCSIDGQNRHGVCLEKNKCLLSGGTPTSTRCNFFSTCCSYETNCVRTSDKKQGFFQSGNLNLHTRIPECTYTIKLRNRNVCQVRLDFEELTLSPAVMHDPMSETRFYSCINDVLNIKPNYHKIPQLCGNNTRQHLYVHLDQNVNPVQAVTISINLAKRSNSAAEQLPHPRWKIKFTQLECPVKKQHKFDLISKSPPGALQYFTEPTGSFWSFGYDLSPNQFSYPYDEHYTIAFKRSLGSCGVKFTANYLNIANVDTSQCADYLFIPEYVPQDATTDLVVEGKSSGKVCYSDILNTPITFYSATPGPFYVNFKAKSYIPLSMAADDKLGFYIDYEILPTSRCPFIDN
ncbi:hypothetical protein ABEB36_006555 [Hypothenemus hampei]|uniref:CUB domain-containing protein n=1 Tax=Hypothenemus hampei TaxID=57062 RepID=A0ABD1EQX0_HYPHA